MRAEDVPPLQLHHLPTSLLQFFLCIILLSQTAGGKMRLLSEKMGIPLEVILSEGTTEDDLPRTKIHQKKGVEPTIIWAVEMDGVKIYLTNGKPLRLLIIVTFMQREEYVGPENIARALENRGILETTSHEAYKALPAVVSQILRLRQARREAQKQLPLLLDLIP